MNFIAANTVVAASCSYDLVLTLCPLVRRARLKTCENMSTTSSQESRPGHSALLMDYMYSLNLTAARSQEQALPSPLVGEVWLSSFLVTALP